MADYYSSADYEQGYFASHGRNSGFYAFLEKNFSNKRAVGVRVYYKMRKIGDAVLPAPFAGEQAVMKRLFSPASEMLGSLCIPTVYDGEAECGIAFGEDVLAVETLPNKLVIDVAAAGFLKKRGIDAGIDAETPIGPPDLECFDEEKVLLSRNGGGYFACTLKEGARVLSRFGNGSPASFLYRSGNTLFLVLCIDAYSLNPDNSFFRSYARQQQLLDFTGATFPVIKKSPFVYTLCKTDGKQTAAVFLNIFEDPVDEPVICLGREYRRAEFYGAEGRLDSERITLSAPVPPFGAFAVVLE